MWSWKYSRCTNCSSASAGCRWIDGPQCSDSGISARVAQRVDPQQLGDPGAARDVGLEHVDGAGIEHALEVRAGRSRTRRRRSSIPAGARSRIRRRPSRSSEDTGSSNQLTPASARKRSASSSACLREYAPLASTNSSASAPIASRAARTRPGSSLGVAADLHLDARNPALHPAGELLGQPRKRIGGEPARPVDRRLGRAPRPSSSHSGSPRSRAFRSHNATSTAAIAIDAMPGPAEVADRSRPSPSTRPRATSRRHAANDARQLGLDQLRRRDVGVGVAEPHSPAACAWTTTIVVESQDSVPSASGASVGIV